MEIPTSEFQARVACVQSLLRRHGVDAGLVYYDELRSANGFYLSNWVPQFESGAVLVPVEGEPWILGGPESEPFAKADAAIKKTFNVPVFMVPDEEYPYARILSVREVLTEALNGRSLRRLGIVGLAVMPHALHAELTHQLGDVELVDITEPYEQLRWFKSDAEVASIREAFGIASQALAPMSGQIVAGNSEQQVAAAGEAKARGLGCTGFGYRTIVGSGPWAGSVVPTPTTRRLTDRELVMFSISPKVNGYASSVGDTTVVGGVQSEAQRRLLSHMAHAFDIARKQLVVGRTGVEMDAPIRAYLLECGYAPYMLVPYIHTVGLFEAEGPFFGPLSHVALQPHMTVCIDISLFGMPDLHGARFESGFAITEDGVSPFAPEIDELILSHR